MGGLVLVDKERTGFARYFPTVVKIHERRQKLRTLAELGALKEIDRITKAAVLSEMKDSDIDSAILALFKTAKRPEWHISSEAKRAMFSINKVGNPALVELGITIMESNGSVSEKRDAVQLLREMGERGIDINCAWFPFKTLLRDDNKYLSWDAALALATLVTNGSSFAFDTIVGGLEVESLHVRINSVKALATLAERGSNDAFNKLLEESTLESLDFRDYEINVLGGIVTDPVKDKVLSKEDILAITVHERQSKLIDVEPFAQVLAKGVEKYNLKRKAQLCRTFGNAAELGINMGNAVEAFAGLIDSCDDRIEGNSRFLILNGLMHSSLNGVDISKSAGHIGNLFMPNTEGINDRRRCQWLGVRVLNIAAQDRRDIDGAFPGLVKALSQNDPSVKANAVEALLVIAKTRDLSCLSPHAEHGIDADVMHEFVSTLATLMEDESAHVRNHAAEVLSELAKQKISITNAVPALRKTFEEKQDMELRKKTLGVLMETAPHSNMDDAIDAVTAALTDGDMEIQRNALETLKGAALFGTNISRAFPILRNMLDDRDESIREATTWTFANALANGDHIRGYTKIRKDFLRKILDGRIGTSKGSPSWKVVEPIRNGHYITTSVVPKLAQLLTDDPNEVVRRAAAVTIQNAAKKGIDISKAVPALAKALQSPDEAVKPYSADALDNAVDNGCDIREALPGLVHLGYVHRDRYAPRNPYHSPFGLYGRRISVPLGSDEGSAISAFCKAVDKEMYDSTIASDVVQAGIGIDQYDKFNGFIEPLVKIAKRHPAIVIEQCIRNLNEGSEIRLNRVLRILSELPKNGIAIYDAIPALNARLNDPKTRSFDKLRIVKLFERELTGIVIGSDVVATLGRLLERDLSYDGGLEKNTRVIVNSLRKAARNGVDTGPSIDSLKKKLIAGYTKRLIGSYDDIEKGIVEILCIEAEKGNVNAIDALIEGLTCIRAGKTENITPNLIDIAEQSDFRIRRLIAERIEHFLTSEAFIKHLEWEGWGLNSYFERLDELFKRVTELLRE